MKKSELQQIIKEEISKVLNEEDPLQTAFNKKLGVEPGSSAINTQQSKEWMEGKSAYRTDPTSKNPYVRDLKNGESKSMLAKKAEQWTLGFSAAMKRNPPTTKPTPQPNLSSYYKEKGSGGYTGD
jgi:hypothetical protein